MKEYKKMVTKIAEIYKSNILYKLAFQLQFYQYQWLFELCMEWVIEVNQKDHHSNQ